ncbi:MAG: translation elongation factor 4 [bacterium]
MTNSNIRNFCIIAHIDHGKSTLADRFLDVTKTLDQRLYKDKKQVLDTMELEQERGITIKLQPVRMNYKDHILNLIDTPGHVDFTYEVSRSLAACDGAILVVDSTQGIEAQTLANFYLALDQGLEIIPVLNKVDLPSAKPEQVAEEIEKVLGLPKESVILASAKSGIGIEEILDRVISDIPAPKGNENAPLQALVFDSSYNPYKGVIACVCVKEGTIKRRDDIIMMMNSVKAEILEIGVFRPMLVPVEQLVAGEVGYIATGLKSLKDLAVGDTITLASNPAPKALEGYKTIKPMVFAGLYPVEGDEYGQLREALEKLQLNDASLAYEPEVSGALGNGFRCGFLGLLHMEIIQERLEREYDLDLITTAPSVKYIVKVQAKNNTFEDIEVNSASEFPDPAQIVAVSEPWVKINVISPSEYVGSIMEMVTSRRGIYKTTEYFDTVRVNVVAEIPLSEILTDFYNDLKSATSGYASMDYELLDYREGQLVKMDILVAGDVVEAMSIVVPRVRAQVLGRDLTKKLKEVIPRQMYEVSIQAAIGGKIVARESISAVRKDVTAKLYGGDITRKRKLLEKQKKGKKRMKQVGKIEIPQEAFMAVLKLGGGGEGK